jgi:Tfp pilus assembly PilM family ATPase
LSRTRSLPLGLDLGTSRVRVAKAVLERGSTVRIVAVTARDIATTSADVIGTIVEELAREVGGRERRCVTSMGAPEAIVRTIQFPPMTWTERRRAARFEARRFVPWDVDALPTRVRLCAVDSRQRLFAVAAIREHDIEAKLHVIRDAGLRSIAIDHDGIALRRALPLGDAIVDIGAERSTVHVYEEAMPRSLAIGLGGKNVTVGIAADLGIDQATAERRKRILGQAGAGADACDSIVRALAQAIERMRTRMPIAGVTLTGNGARLPGLAAALELATGVSAAIPISPLLDNGSYADDVLRAAGPDWAMAAGLASWGAAA